MCISSPGIFRTASISISTRTSRAVSEAKKNTVMYSFYKEIKIKNQTAYKIVTRCDTS